MYLQILENIFLGFAISAVPGAVFFETIRRSLSKNPTVIPFQVGNFLGVISIATAAFLGVSVLLLNSNISGLFYGLSGGLLLYIGISAIFSNPKYESQSASITKAPCYASFVSGLILAIANPISIIFWIGLTGKFYERSSTLPTVLIYTVSVIFGAVMLFVILIATVMHMRSRIKQIYLIIMSRLFGAVVAIYGLMMIAKLFS